ncbi:hypothetical protein GTA62_05645 [Roseobacter sp. HKCCD9010]|uniref:hypothetical protein n=1 Tax=unclassified Roseobacter TaxID=196798 RepID=UPI00149282DE|nr:MULTISPECIES: hypothetical protein [unclassified Roseobacter]MBF9048649.1 hypothetical protein [Rhodobacterales bacterium HKCCD4356]NNV10648.1 hypothetical protein [Roseobacter sp. HKCCD7357]NNV14833.1 hypothetical protein [Roseobacter sp. HKCCD8768]NNV24292.1 hypothetical protein [Roseobacter sp. HKCCD8192]NNV28549.1 hypothetical protein [Roseobacter sp. HKCCD9061]
MAKLIAILNVVAWSGFWAFGYLALSADVSQTGQMITAVILAAVGGGLSLFAYLWLVRHSENTGYAKRPNRGTPTFDDEEAV